MPRASWSEDDLQAAERRMGVRGTSNCNRVDGTRVGVAGVTAVPKSNPSSPSPSFLLTLAITGQLPSGKNQVQLSFKNGKVHKYANKTFTNWRSLAHVQILEQRNRVSMAPPITIPVRVRVAYWPGDMRTRDVSGQLDALMHLLVYANVLKDDGLIYDCTWTRMDLNRKFPKTIMEIAPWE